MNAWSATRGVLLALGAVVWGPLVTAADTKKERVKDITADCGTWDNRSGIVGRIDADGVTLVEVNPNGQPVEHFFVPVDRLRKGEILDDVWGMYAYRWQDMKPGDTVELRGRFEKADGVTYCLKICIRRRPKATLPESQLPKDDHRYAGDRIRNELENGVDVPDEELLKVFPPQPAKKDQFDNVTPAFPGGVTGEYKEKLDAIRAKKKDEVKAPPPEKKK